MEEIKRLTLNDVSPDILDSLFETIAVATQNAASVITFQPNPGIVIISTPSMDFIIKKSMDMVTSFDKLKKVEYRINVKDTTRVRTAYNTAFLRISVSAEENLAEALAYTSGHLGILHISANG